jgi:hypothetical protein
MSVRTTVMPVCHGPLLPAVPVMCMIGLAFVHSAISHMTVVTMMVVVMVMAIFCQAVCGSFGKIPVPGTGQVRDAKKYRQKCRK